MFKNLVLRLEFAKEFGWKRKFPRAGKVTPEVLEWAERIMKEKQ